MLNDVSLIKSKVHGHARGYFSPQFGQWTAVPLHVTDNEQLWVAERIAHGFLVLSDSAQVSYKTTDYYCPDNERSIRFDDPSIGIVWPDGREFSLSDRYCIHADWCRPVDCIGVVCSLRLWVE